MTFNARSEVRRVLGLALAVVLGLLARSASASPTNTPDPFATFVVQYPLSPPSSNPSLGSHVVEFLINAAQPIKTLHATFTADPVLSSFGPVSSFLIGPAAATSGTYAVSTAAQQWKIDLEFSAAQSGLFPVVRLDELSHDQLNWAYGASATGTYGDGTPFSLGYFEIAIPEPASVSMGLVAAWGLTQLARVRARRASAGN